MLRNLSAIFWKNFVLRKRHWLLTITECFVPTILFLLMTHARSNVNGLMKVYVNEPTYHNVQSLNKIYSHLNVGSLKLWYAPNTDVTGEIIRNLQLQLGIFGEAVKEFNDKTQMLADKDFKKDSYIAAVIFNRADNSSLNYDLTIYKEHLNWNTDKLLKSSHAITEETEHPSYLANGYAALQIAIDIAYMQIFSKNVRIPEISLQQFPDPPRTVDSALNDLFVQFLPAVTVFSFIFLCPAVLQRVCEEKASGTKELMKMVGLRSSQIWFGWFVYALGTNLISVVVIVVLMKVPLWGVPYPLVEHSDGTVLFVFLFLYCMAAITFSFVIANIFKKPIIATNFGILFWIVSYELPQRFVSSFDFLLWRFNILFGALPNMALYYGYSSISVYEMREIGIQWSNLFEPGSGDDQDITMGNVFVLLSIQIVFFMLLTLYIENVNPGKYGIPKPFGFPLQAVIKFFKRSILCKNKSEEMNEIEQRSSNLEAGLLEETQFINLNMKTKKKEQSIEIINLKKEYPNYIAIDKLNLDIEEKCITVLLGENGAGKTTLMSILSGMINATSGSVFVNGKDIKQNIDDVRRIMGLCPQHNLLFTDLTVYEHIHFFAKLKGLKNPEDEINNILKEFDLYEKKNFKPDTLSGGMKRKLCLALALIGGSEILILDEPTSGVDPESRRKLWNLLLKYKKSKTILISTHFMEEAEAVGDKIVIMANGQVQTEGTPSHLKTKYNTGYYLSLELESKDSICAIQEKITKHFQNTKISQETNNSVVFSLPFVENNSYSILLEELEKSEKNLQIKNINIKSSTLNDVFLKAKDLNNGYVEDDGYRLCIFLESSRHTSEIRKIVMCYFPKARVLRENYLQLLMVKLNKHQEGLKIIDFATNVTTKNTGKQLLDMSPSRKENNVYLCLLLKSKRFLPLIKKAVKNHYFKAKLLNDCNNDDFIKYELPLCKNYNCSRLINKLEENIDDWDIFSINIKGIFPEGVYLKINDEDYDYQVDKSPVTIGLSKQLSALFTKRLYFLKHTYKSFLLTVAATNLVFFLAILLTMSNNNISRQNEPSLKLSLDTYGNSRVYYGKNLPGADDTQKLCNFYSKSVWYNTHTADYPVSQVSDAIIDAGLTNLAFYKKHMIVAAEFNSTEIDNILVNAMYSSEAIHGIPITINLATNALAKFLIDKDVSITIRNTPIKPLTSQLTPSVLSVVDVSSIWLILIPISFFFFGCYFILFLHSEVSTKFIKQQINCGLDAWFYWLVNMIFDSVCSIVQIVVFVAGLYLLDYFVLNSNGFTHSDIYAITTIFGVYIITSLPFTYLFSYEKTVSAGMALFFITGIFLGIIPTLIVDAIQFSNRNVNIMEHLKPFLIILSPQFAVSDMILKFSRKYVDNFNWKFMDSDKKEHICKTEPNPCCFDPYSKTCAVYQSYFQNEKTGIQNDLLFMCFACVLYCLCFLLSTSSLWSKFNFQINKSIHFLLSCKKTAVNTVEEDELAVIVEKEEEKSLNSSLSVENLTKKFGANKVVKNLTFHLDKNQCFGLLGVNGAGKSTTFAILTKYLLFDEGRISLAINQKQEENKKTDCSKHGKKENRKQENGNQEKIVKITNSEYGKKIGYCPQQNSLNFVLTGRELIYSMALLRGYPSEGAEKTTNYLLKNFGLAKYADKPCYQYSGGNKRKLNTSLAFLGDPTVIFLDEPTSGVDPVSQRKFWRVLTKVKKSLKSTFLLCSHSMEECETLCDKIAIMKNGTAENPETPVKLKQKLENMYNVTIEFIPNSSRVKDIVEKAKKLLQSNFEKYYGDTVIIKVKNNRLSQIFYTLEQLKLEYSYYIKNILIDSVSLEDVFLTFSELNKELNHSATTEF